MTDVDALDTREIGGVTYRVYLEQDPDCESPREFDAVAGRIVAYSREYVWPQENGDQVSAVEITSVMGDRSFHVIARWLRAFHGASTVLPLYSRGDGRPVAGDETDTPDAGNYVGVTFDQPSTRRVTGVLPAHMAIALSVDVNEYSDWAVGETYGWVIERTETDDSDSAMLTGTGWEQVDACWGLIGDEYARMDALRALGDL